MILANEHVYNDVFGLDIEERLLAHAGAEFDALSINDVMCVWNVVYGMPFTSANQWTLMRSFSGLAASSSHFATASVKRFKP